MLTRLRKGYVSHALQNGSYDVRRMRACLNFPDRTPSFYVDKVIWFCIEGVNQYQKRDSGPTLPTFVDLAWDT